MATRGIPQIPPDSWFELMAKQADDLFYVYSLNPPGFTYVSAASTRIVGYTPEEHYADPDLGLKIVHADDRHVLEEIRGNPGASSRVEIRWRHKDGHTVWVEQRNQLLTDAEGRPQAIVGVARDLSEQRVRNRTLSRHARFYVALSEINQAIVRGATEAELFEMLCHCAVTHGELIGAWVGRLAQDGRRVEPIVGKGLGAEYAKYVVISSDPDVPEGQGPTGTALRTGRAAIANNFLTDPRTAPWREMALAAGVASSAAIPLTRAGKVIGALNLYAAEPGYFDDELVALLGELASDVSYALDSFDKERRRFAAESALKQSEARYRQMFDLSPQPMWVFDVATLRFLAVNQAAIERYGYSHEEFLLMTIADIRPAEDLERLAAAVGRTQGMDHAGVWRHCRKNGEIIEVEITSHGLTFFGRPAELVLAHDLTPQRRAERELRESEQKYRMLFETATDAVCLADTTARVVDCNRRACELFGRTRAEMIGLTAFDVVPEFQPSGERSDVLIGRAIAHTLDGQRVDAEFRYVGAGGLELDAEIRMLRVDLGEQPYLQVIVHDITARKQDDERRRRESLRYKTLIQSAFDGIHILDASGDLIEANDRFYEMLGYDPAAPPRLNVADWEARWSGAELMRELARDLEMAQTFETVHRRKDGTTFPVEVSARGINLGDSKVLYCAARDLTARKEAEQERASLQRALLQAQKMESVGRLAGGVAHDFNNLLTVISGYASLLVDDAAADSKLSMRAKEIARATERATELTRKLLIFSRRHPDEPKVIAIDDFLQQEARLVHRLIGEHIAVATSPCAPRVHVRVDPAQLAQVLMNLVVNARDAMPEGGQLTLSTHADLLPSPVIQLPPGAHAGAYARLAVSDSGCGMSQEVQAHLFEPFFTTKEVGKGTGLGLATAYGIVQQAGGFIDVKSAEGAGTTMSVLLPVVATMANHESPDVSSIVVGGHEAVLVVEDEPTVRELTRTVLERLGYAVTDARDPVDAIQTARRAVRESKSFDLVVTDVVMPGMNGRKLVEELRRVLPPFEVLYVSGFADTGVAGTDQAFEDTAHFLPKPFSPSSLARKVRELLDAREARRR